VDSATHQEDRPANEKALIDDSYDLGLNSQHRSFFLEFTMALFRLIGFLVKAAVGVFAFVFIAILVFGNNHTEINSTPLAGSPMVSRSSCTVTADGFANLRTGDSYQTAVRKLGCNGSEMSRSEIADYTTVMYTWEGKDFASNMNAMFQNDKLVSKAQFGLR
jgi:hypothetical protein